MPDTLTSDKSHRLKRHAQALGCPELIRLNVAPSASNLEYLDLLSKPTDTNVLPDAVAEFQGRPLLYLVDGFDEAGKPQLLRSQIQSLQMLLANRSEHACLGVSRPGSLDIYPINIDRATLAKADFKTIQIAQPGTEAFFQSLATGAFDVPGRPKQSDYIFQTIHDLLSAASEDLAGSTANAGPMHGLEVLSTTGRALFFRFLIDRQIVLPTEIKEICPNAADLRDVFSDAEKAAATSCWLDETFNGDLLPLVPELNFNTNRDQRLKAYRKFYRATGTATDLRLFSHLQAILRGWKNVGGATFQTTFHIDWDDFNFAHIPIGVLSQVYETFSRQWDEEYAQETSVYYTPKNIAKLLVEEAFAGLRNPEEAVILDPACGAGMFLVLSFRQLIRKHWEKTGIRPDTRTIQRILYRQLRGFEVSESALRLCALALYISAIEVNGAPRPPRSLKFPRPLRDEVLFNFGNKDTDRSQGFVLGSLGPDVPKELDGHFDIVVTNPPWTRLRASSNDEEDKTNEQLRAAEMNSVFTSITRRALTSRGLEDIANAYTNPDNNPDLPFLWRATEWAKPNGIIAMALPGRIILKQSGKGKAARDAIMKGLSLTGILNGSDLEKTPVWPKMDLPFMLLFARNKVPGPQHRFYFATPIRENRLSSRGQFRLDYQAAEAILSDDVVNKPSLLKAIAVGTILDAEVVERLTNNGWKTLGEIWEELSLACGDGYHIFPQTNQKDASDLFDLPDFVRPNSGFSIDFDALQTWKERYKRTTAHAPRTPSLFSSPLVIIPQTPGESRDRPKAFISRTNAIAFSQGNYGFAASGHESGELLVSLLYLLTHSQLYQHFCLIRSSRIGASYRTFIKEDLEAFPFPYPSQLKALQKRKIISLAKNLESAPTRPWQELDDFIFELYSLSEEDAMVVRDTVTFSGPYRSVREPAEQPAQDEDIEHFRAYLEEMLQPLFTIIDQKVVVRTEPTDTSGFYCPWRFLSISLANDLQPSLSKLLRRLMLEANKVGASRVILRVPSGGLILGILNQRRFWTRSRARLCSLYIEQHHLDSFPI